MGKAKGAILGIVGVLAVACHAAKDVPSTSGQMLPTAEVATSVATTQSLPDSSLSAPKINPIQSSIPQNTKADPQPNLSSVSTTSLTTVQPQETLENALQDQPVFAEEELIDVSQRRLHPYTQKHFLKDAKQKAPWAYEQLKYGIYYSFIKAGTAYIRNRGLVNIDGKTAYLLQTSAFSATIIDAFFKVRDINHSWLDAENFHSLGYGQSVREGSYHRDEWVSFDYPQKRFFGEIQKKEAPRSIRGPLEINVLDMLSSLYYVRAQKLEVGNDLVFDIINREKQYPLIVKVLKKEKIKTSAGTFNTILVEPQIRGEGIFVAKGKNLKVWLTDDEYKMPVKMKVEVFIGSVSAELLEYKRQEATNIL